MTRKLQSGHAKQDNPLTPQTDKNLNDDYLLFSLIMQWKKEPSMNRTKEEIKK